MLFFGIYQKWSEISITTLAMEIDRKKIEKTLEQFRAIMNNSIIKKANFSLHRILFPYL